MSSTVVPEDNALQSGLQTTWKFLEDHGFTVLALLLIYLVLKPVIAAKLDARRKKQSIERGLDPERTKDLRAEMLAARERQQKEWADKAARDAEEALAAKRAAKKAGKRTTKPKPAPRKPTPSSGGGPLDFSGGRQSRVIGGPSARYKRRGGG